MQTRSGRSYNINPLVTRSEYFKFILIMNYGPTSTLGACPYYVVIQPIKKRKKFIPTRKWYIYRFETCEFADLFFKAISIYPPSQNLKDYGTEGEEAWYHFDIISHSFRQQERTKYGV